MRVPYGDWVAYEPALVVGLCALFVLMCGVAPWRRLRNLDVIAALSLVTSVVLFQHRYHHRQRRGRRARVALPAASMRRQGARSAARAAAIDAVARRDHAGARSGAKRSVAARTARRAGARVFMMWGELARCRRRDLRGHGGRDQDDPRRPSVRTHAAGRDPRRHLPDPQLRAVHPAGAGGARERSLWDSVDGGLAVAVVAALVAAWAVFRTTAGTRPRSGARRPAELEEAGLRAAVAWLAFPLGPDHCLDRDDRHRARGDAGYRVLLWRRPDAVHRNARAPRAGSSSRRLRCVPVSLAPLRGRAARAGDRRDSRAVSLPMVVVFLALGGISGPEEMIHAVCYQFTRGARAVPLERARDRQRSSRSPRGASSV